MKYSDIYNHDNNELHRDVKEEILFFHSAVKGDMKAIQKNIEDRRFRDQNGVGTLSVDPVLNLKYHMVITTGILTRLCIEQGLNAETAFRMSDYYIKKLDNAKTEDDVEKIHSEMLLDFTGHMHLMLNDSNMSRHVRQCIDYIYAHLGERITVKNIADHIKVSVSYLSQEFSKEVGKSISDFIREKKIKMAQEMLLNTDLSISEISYRLSFSSQSHFIQIFSSLIGMTPKKFRDNSRCDKWVDSNTQNDKERYPYLSD